MNVTNTIDRAFIVLGVIICLYCFFWLVDKNQRGKIMFKVCNWCGMLFKKEDCVKNKIAYTGYFCKECFKNYKIKNR